MQLYVSSGNRRNNVSNVFKASSNILSGLKRSQFATKNIYASILKQNRQKVKFIGNKSILFQKRQESIRRKEQESLIEASKMGSGTSSFSKVSSTVLNSTKGFLGRLSDYAGSLLVGWLLFNIPTIIKMSKALIKRITALVNVGKSFVDGISEFGSSVIQTVVSLFTNIRNFDFTDSSGKVKEGMERMQDSFKEFESSVDEVISYLEKDYNGFVEFFGLPKIGLPVFKKQTPTVQETKNNKTAETAGNGGTKVQQPTTTKTTSGSWKPILDLLGRAEADSSGGYDAMNPGRNTRNEGNPVSEMTIAQAAKYAGDRNDGRNYGVGRYQFTSLTTQAKDANISLNEKFSPENQDKIAIFLAKRRGVTLDLIRKDPTKAGNLLAREWAGLPILSGKNRGKSYYDGVGNNKAIVTPEYVEKVFRKYTTVQKVNQAMLSIPNKFTSSSGYNVANLTGNASEMNINKLFLEDEEENIVIVMPPPRLPKQPTRLSNGSNSSKTIYLGNSLNMLVTQRLLSLDLAFT